MEKEILSFGPFTIEPEYQRKGYGRKLLDCSLSVAKKMGYPVALLVKELENGVLSGKSWKYVESPAYNLDESGFEEYDSTFPQMEKGYKYTQELFYVYSRSNVLR